MGLSLTIKTKQHVILTDCTYGNYEIQEAIGCSRQLLLKEKSGYGSLEGMDYLLSCSRYQILNESNIMDGIIYVKKNLGVIPGTMRKEKRKYEKELIREYENILKYLEQTSDYVFVNCTHISYEIKRNIQKLASMVVVNATQNIRDLNDFFSYPPEYISKALFCIGNYLEKDPENLQNIQRVYQLGNRWTGIIPYNKNFITAVEKGKALQFFRDYKLQSRDMNNSYFFRESFHMAEQLQKFKSWYSR